METQATEPLDPPDVRLIAFHLPQFHPIPENDRWWGKGFTEWTNVARARPQFPGHYQPHLPADLGYYDLRLPDARKAQADLARAYGIEGFCYWHYWFHGKRLLERPVDEILASGEPDFPFCLAWANESWSRRWLGDEKEVLLAQTYSEADDLDHARWLAEAFSDRRYVRVGGRPLFLIYRPTALPDPRRTADTLRGECVRLGVAEPFLVGVDSHCVGTDLKDRGFDMTHHFEPQLSALGDAFDDAPRLGRLVRNLKQGIVSASKKVYRCADAAGAMAWMRPKFPHFPGCFVGWDNTARRGRNGIVVTDSTPEAFGGRLREAIRSVLDKPREERIVFINAWNEWAEGNHLEPDAKYGLRMLEEVASAVDELRPSKPGAGGRA